MRVGYLPKDMDSTTVRTFLSYGISTTGFNGDRNHAARYRIEILITSTGPSSLLAWRSSIVTFGRSLEQENPSGLTVDPSFDLFFLHVPTRSVTRRSD